jgi:putative peptidoglycan lipid II flippase
MLRSSLLITVLSLLGSFLGLMVQLLMAQRYGAGVEVDTYLYAISTPTFVAGMIASLLSYTVVPRMAQNYGQVDKQHRLIASLLALSACIAAALVLASPLLRVLQKQILPTNSTILQQHVLANLLLLGWSIAGVQVLLAALCAILTGLKQAFTATLLNFGPYLGMLGLMIAAKDKGIEQMAYGLLYGTVASLLAAFYLLRVYILGHWRKAAWEEIRTIVLRSPYTIIAMSCFSAYAVIDSYWAPRAGEGVLASLGYSQRIIIALGTLVVVGPSAILVPKFSEIIADGSRVAFYVILKKTLVTTLVIGCALAMGLYAWAEPLIQLLFTRGDFDQQDAARVAAVLQFCLPGMVCMLLSVISLRVLFCFQDVEKTAALLGLFWVVAYFSLAASFIGFSARGIALAYSFTWMIYLILLGAVINKNINIRFTEHRND